MSRQNWDNDSYEDDYDKPLFLFPDDDESDDEQSLNSSDDTAYDLRAAEPDTDSTPQRKNGSKAPMEYPEGSLGSFSTPEDYEAHASAAQEDDQEYDSPILLFPPDEVEYDEEASVTGSRRTTAAEEGDLDDSIGISFSRYSAENKEGEFFFMPFLDIPDEVEYEEDEEDDDEGEEISFSFSKVDADQIKKEKEFIFMPFLNISENESEEDEPEEDSLHHRSSKGTIFDEGLYLIPLESEEEEPEEEKKDEEPEEDDSGIYVVSSVGGVVPKAPNIPQVKEKKTTLKSDVQSHSAPKKKKKPTGQTSGKKQPPKSGSKTGKNGGKLSSTEEQFRKAMRNVSPEIRAAVKNDPVQRAALEQAVRIALVQQAAQEAVEKATGRPVFGGSSAAAGKKRRIPKPPQQASNSFLGKSTRAGSMSFSPFSLRTQYEDGGVSEFGVTEEKKSTATEFGTTTQSSTAATTAAADTAGDAAAKAAEAQNVAPDSSQDAALDALAGKTTPRTHSAYQSPAAVRAAMRTGIDFDALQPSSASAGSAAAAKPAMSAAEQELQAKRSGCLMWIIVAFVAFFVGLIAILVLPNVGKQNKYEKALNLMEAGQYLEAIDLFDDFGSGDTKYYNDCRTNISDCALRQANQYFAEGKYYEAYNLLLDKATVNSETKALALKCNYYYAEQRYAEGDWQTAAASYSNLLNEQYEDSQEKYNICQYQLAMQHAEQGNYMQAHQGFAMLGDYSDSAYRAACMIYHAWNADISSVTSGQLAGAVSTLNENAGNGEALDMLNGIYVKATDFAASGQHRSAFETFDALGDYSDSRYKAALSLHGLWNTEPSYGTLTQREKAMTALRERIGNEIAADALNSSGFNPVRLVGRWTDGENHLVIQRTDAETDTLSIDFEVKMADDSMVSVKGEGVGFDGNVVYLQSDPNDSSSRQLIFEVTGFDTLVAQSPGAFSLYCFQNNEEYEFQRN